MLYRMEKNLPVFVDTIIQKYGEISLAVFLETVVLICGGGSLPENHGIWSEATQQKSPLAIR